METGKTTTRSQRVMMEANALALSEHLEPKQIAVRLGISHANLKMCASRAGMRYRRQPGYWMPSEDTER